MEGIFFCEGRGGPIGRMNPQGPGEFDSKEGETAQEQSDGDPSRDLKGEGTKREIPGHCGEQAEAHRPQAQPSQLNGSPSVHDDHKLSMIGPLFFPARDSVSHQ